MATKRQIAANRRNARKCTGPKTPEGKATASMNALRHGLRARTVVLKSENQDDFDEILGGLQNQYQPQTPAEQHLVDQAAIAQWKLVRAEAFESDCYEKAKSADARAAIFGRMTQFQCRLERSYFKAYKELERIKAARPKPPAASKKPDQPPAKALLRWVKGSSGETEILCKLENGKAVKHFSDELPILAEPLATGKK